MTTTETANAQICAQIVATGETVSVSSIPELINTLKNDFGLIAGPETHPAIILQAWVTGGLIRLNPKSEPERKRPESEPAPSEIPFTEIKEEAPKFVPMPKPTETAKIQAQPKKQDTSKAAELLSEFIKHLTPEEAPINPDTVREIVREELSKQEPRKVEIKVNELPPVQLDVVHPNFEKLLKLTAIRKSVYLFGDRGTGKSTAARNAAKVLGLSFFSLPCSAQTTKIDLFGYKDATGKYVSTLFYEAYTAGGIFLLDEMDAVNENVLISVNDALSSNSAAFPCGMVEKHPDFICIAAGNTIGSGASKNYTGRRPLDAASLDRFIFLDWPICETMERKLSTNDEFTKWVQETRKKCKAAGIQSPSPRASIEGGQLISAGFTMQEAKEMVFLNKLSEAEKITLKA